MQQTRDFLACQNLSLNVHHPRRLKSLSKVQVTFELRCLSVLCLSITLHVILHTLRTTWRHNHLHVYHIISTSYRAFQIIHYDIGRSLETLTKNILYIRSKLNEVDVRYIKRCTFEERQRGYREKISNNCIENVRGRE